MPSVELSCGPIDYADTGGDGPTLVLLHGLLMDRTLWDDVVAALGLDYRCVTPTLPLGAHRHATRKGTDLSLRGMGSLVAEFLDALALTDVTLVGNDTGGAVVQLVAASSHPRVGKIALVSCEAFDNIPPGLTGKAIALTARLSPALFGLFMQQLRLKLMRRLPIAFGWLTKRGDAVTRRWLDPIWHDAAIRRDAVAVIRGVMRGKALLRTTSESLGGFQRPALVVWASEDKVMPIEHGQRLAALLPVARFEQVADSYTLVPLDQPAALAGLLKDFAVRP
jgi:pimeloyl-ACP methyl ester carboxylesterase